MAYSTDTSEGLEKQQTLSGEISIEHGRARHHAIFGAVVETRCADKRRSKSRAEEMQQPIPPTVQSWPPSIRRATRTHVSRKLSAVQMIGSRSDLKIQPFHLFPGWSTPRAGLN